MSPMEKFALVRTDPTTFLSHGHFNRSPVPGSESKLLSREFHCGLGIWASWLALASLSCVLGLSNEGSPMVCIQSGGDIPNNSHGSVFHFWHGSQRGLAIAEHRDCLRPLKRNLIIGSV